MARKLHDCANTDYRLRKTRAEMAELRDTNAAAQQELKALWAWLNGRGLGELAQHETRSERLSAHRRVGRPGGGSMEPVRTSARHTSSRVGSDT